MEERRGLTIKDLLIRIILIIIFIFLLIWLFPMPDLKPLNYQIFADNLDRMKNAAKSYYTLERLPKEVNTSKRMTLKEMIDSKNKLLLPLMDSNGNYCSEDDSYVEITKLENEYVIKVYLSCSDKQDYIIEHYGCYDICSDTCKALEETSKSSSTSKVSTTKKVAMDKTTTTKRQDIITTKKKDKIYEYEFVKNECTEVFDRLECLDDDYYLVGDTCFKESAQVVSYPAKEVIEDVISTDSLPAEPVVSKDEKVEAAVCTDTWVTSTIDAGYTEKIYSATLRTTKQEVSADEIYSYDIKGAVETTKTIYADYNIVNNYDIVDADKVYSSYKWTYVSTLVTTEAGLEFVNDKEKRELRDSWTELECPGSSSCGNVVVYYKYWNFKKEVSGTPTYTCDSHPGYDIYNGNKCRRFTGTTKTCPDKTYTDTGTGCVKEEKGVLSCEKYGKGYEPNYTNKTCVKKITSYKCPDDTKKTSDPKICIREKQEYVCPSYMEQTGTNGEKCIDKTDFWCWPNTEDQKFELNGTKCTVRTKVKACSCKSYPGSVQSQDKKSCIKTNEHTDWSCEKYGKDYDTVGDRCVKTVVTKKTTWSCEEYEDTTLDEKTKQCVKTIVKEESKEPEKKYKTSCEQKYMWSTETSVDGWTYTGNKRLIN